MKYLAEIAQKSIVQPVVKTFGLAFNLLKYIIMNEKIVSIVALLVTVTTNSNSFADEHKAKYLGFELNPVYGINYYDVKHNVKAPSSLIRSYTEFFGAETDFFRMSILSYLEFLPGNFAIIGGAGGTDKDVLDRFTDCDLKGGDGKPEYASPCATLTGLVNTHTNDIVRLNTLDMLDLGSGGISSAGGYVSREGFPIYGCYLGNPLSSADLNLDGIPELFVVGGVGDYWGPEEGGTAAMTSVYIFDVSDTSPTVLLKVELSFENYSPKDLLRSKSLYQSYSTTKLEYDGTSRDVKIPEQGIRRYSKIFFKDFDRNGKLDILVWQREYKARLTSDPVEGYQLNEVRFQHYEESDSGYVEKGIDSDIAEKYLADQSLTWRSGFPSVNLCRWGTKEAPLIGRFKDPRQNIDDPVLKK